MQLTKETLEQLADTSRVYLKEEEKDKILKEINQMLTQIRNLEEVETDVLPTIDFTPDKVGFREDIVQKSLSLEEVFRNAPDEYEDFFRVPKIIED